MLLLHGESTFHYRSCTCQSFHLALLMYPLYAGIQWILLYFFWTKSFQVSPSPLPFSVIMFQSFLYVIRLHHFIFMQSFLIDQQDQHQYYLWVWRIKTASWKKKALDCWMLTLLMPLIGYGITVKHLLHHYIADSLFFLIIKINQPMHNLLTWGVGIFFAVCRDHGHRWTESTLRMGTILIPKQQ